jgi:YbbR domain-containing protein
VRRLLDNLVYKLVALLVAVLLWVSAQGVNDIEQSLDLRVAYTDVPEGLVVVEQSATEVNVRVRASRAALRRLRGNLTSYVVSLAGVKEGTAQVPVLPENLPLPRGATISARSPSLLVFRTESVVSKLVQVRPDVGGNLPQGYALRAVRVVPGQVEVAGARTSVRRMRDVPTQRVDISQLRATTTVEAPLLLEPNVWRKDGQQAPVRVTVEIDGPAAAGSGNLSRG